MKKWFCLLAIAISFNAGAQKQRYLEFGVALNRHVIKDDAMSPMRYRGVLPTLSFGVVKETSGRKLTELRIPLQYGKVSAKNAGNYPSMRGDYYRIDIDYVHLLPSRVIKDSLNGELFFGGSFHSLMSGRFMPQLDNSAILYDIFFSVGASVAYRNHFRLKNKILTNYHRLSIPLLSYGTRPDYMNLYDVVDPKNDLIADAFSRGRFVTFGSFSRIIIRNTLLYPIRNMNKLGFTYEWQYYSASFTERVRAASHLIQFSVYVGI